MTGGKLASLWSKIFGKKNSSVPPVIACAPWPPIAGPSPSPRLTGDAPTHICPAKLNLFRALHPACSDFDTTLADAPEWFTTLQGHVTAVQANDAAVHLFRAGRLEAAIAELRRGLEANPHYATGHSNLGFLYLRQAKLEQAVECLLRALEVDPDHRDAPDHLCDVLLAFIDELVHIGLTDGFLATQPTEKFDVYNRHIRTRDIGVLIARIGRRGVFKAEGRALEADLVMAMVFNAVQKKMGACCPASNLSFAWQGIDGWNTPVATPLLPSAHDTCRAGGSWAMITERPHSRPVRGDREESGWT